MADGHVSDAAVLAEMAGAFVVSVSHRPGCETAAEALCSAGLPAPASGARDLVPASGGCFAWLSPTRGILVTRERALAAKVTDGLRPGRCAAAMAVDVSEGHCVLALSGHAIERLLAAGIDPAAPGDTTPTACTCRVFDVKATLLRVDRQRCWLVVESSLADHLAAHLRQSIRSVTQASGAVLSGLAGTSRER
ncbi:MAG: hypothetical protein JNM26_01745 [Ideonella sp.]|nr:hypothetical protein [Ideonella sp.]